MEISKRLLFRKSLILLIPLAASPLLFYGKEFRCIFVIVVMSFYWLSDVIPMGVTALLPLFLFPFFGILGAKDVSMDYFKEQIVLFMTSLIMAMAVEVTNLHRRIALSMLRIVGSNRHCILFGQMVSTAFVSFFVSDTAATTLMLPIVLAILSTLEEIKEKQEGSHENSDTSRSAKDTTHTAKEPTEKEENSSYLSKVKTMLTSVSTSEKVEKKLVCGLDLSGMCKRDRSFCKAMVLATSQASLIGGTGIITGTGTNLVFREQVPSVYPSIEVGYVEWMSFALPFVPIYLAASWLCLTVVLMPRELIPKRFKRGITAEDREVEKGKTSRMKEKIKEAHNDLGRMSFAEASVMVWFILLLLAWCTRDPGFVNGWNVLLPQNKKGKTESNWLVKDSTVAVFVTMLMFIWPRSLTDPKLEPILTWEHMKTKYSWSCTLLIGAGFALSDGVKNSGLGDLLACQMNEVFIHMDKFWLQFLATLTVCFATEFASNVATAGIFIPIMLSLSKGLGLHPLYLVIPVTISCSFAFMFPQATPGNAVVVDTKIVSFFEMMSVGFFLNIVCVWLTVLNCNTYAYWLLRLGHIPESVKAVNNQLNCGGNVTVG